MVRNRDQDKLRPRSLEELQKLILEANSSGVSMYPVSTGYNWGLGANTPVDSKSMLVELSEMNKIIDFDERSGVVVIEPGVSQKQLADYLEKKESDYFIDVTGSSEDTSIVGNTLERGISYQGLRADSVVAFEVLTGKGDIIRTGSWRFDAAKVRTAYQYGIGPDLKSLFFQSNFSVVTKMAYKLKKRKPKNYLISVEFKNIENFYESLKDFSELISDDSIDSIFHIANTERAKGAILPNLRKQFSKAGLDASEEHLSKFYSLVFKSGWVGSGVISGSKAGARLKLREFKARLKKHGKIKVIRVSHIRFLTKLFSFFRKSKIYNLILGITPFLYFNIGKPSDAAIGSVMDFSDFKAKDEGLAKSVHLKEKGFIYCLPLTSMDKVDVSAMINTIEAKAKEYGLEASITLNPLSQNVIEAVVSVEYQKDNLVEAQNCIRQMQIELNEQGHLSYRTNIRDMDLYFADEFYLEYLRAIKKVFDPNSILSPGRYLPEEAKTALKDKKL